MDRSVLIRWVSGILEVMSEAIGLFLCLVLILDHFLFEVVEGGFRIKETGFERNADISAIVIEDAIEESAVLVQF